MKPAVLGIALALGLVALMVTTNSCSVTHRSGDYACTTTNECSTGRTCVGGFCIIPGAIDAPGSNQIDAKVFHDAPTGNCPQECTSCNGSTCIVDCSVNPTACQTMITCPAGYQCDVRCNTDMSCRAGVQCANNESCTVTCSGAGSCRGVACSNGACDVQCTGTNSCSRVNCGNSCKCDIACSGTLSCQNQISCGMNACDATPPPGCTSTGTGCSTTCP